MSRCYDTIVEHDGEWRIRARVFGDDHARALSNDASAAARPMPEPPRDRRNVSVEQAHRPCPSALRLVIIRQRAVAERYLRWQA